jgi:hypothetical protein
VHERELLTWQRTGRIGERLRKPDLAECLRRGVARWRASDDAVEVLGITLRGVSA